MAEEGFNDWLNLANSIKRSGAELVVALTASAEEAVQITRALKTVRAEPKMVYFSQGTQSEFHEGTGDASDSVLVHSSWHPAVPFEGLLAGETFTNQDFVAEFEKAFGEMPDEDAAIPFAVCQGIEQAIIGAGSTDNDAMSSWLKARTAEDAVRTVLGAFRGIEGTADRQAVPDGAVERRRTAVRLSDGRVCRRCSDDPSEAGLLRRRTVPVPVPGRALHCMGLKRRIQRA